jgi:hypothetical protein
MGLFFHFDPSIQYSIIILKRIASSVIAPKGGGNNPPGGYPMNFVLSL